MSPVQQLKYMYLKLDKDIGTSHATKTLPVNAVALLHSLEF
jgi:hypothetical protein